MLELLGLGPNLFTEICIAPESFDQPVVLTWEAKTRTFAGVLQWMTGNGPKPDMLRQHAKPRRKNTRTDRSL
jgi:hypothetical protein